MTSASRPAHNKTYKPPRWELSRNNSASRLPDAVGRSTAPHNVQGTTPGAAGAWNNPTARQHILDAGLTKPQAAATTQEDPETWRTAQDTPEQFDRNMARIRGQEAPQAAEDPEGAQLPGTAPLPPERAPQGLGAATSPEVNVM